MADDNKIDQLREAAKYAIDLLQPNDVVSIIAFESDTKVLIPSQPAHDKHRLKRELDRLEADGGTRMAPAMRSALNEVRKNLSRDRVNRLVILTDGQTDAEDDCVREAEHAAQQGVSIVALGLGTDWNEDLLTQLSLRSGPQGRVDYISQPYEITKYFQEIVKTMQGGIVQNATLTLRLMQGITPRKVWRVAPLIADLGVRPLSDRDVQVSLGEVDKEQGQGILVELGLPPRTNEGRYRIAQADMSYDVPMLGIVGEHVRYDVTVGFVANPTLAQAVNPRVMNIVEKVTAYKLQTRALQEAQTGDRAGATQKLRQAATMLLSQGETNLARTIQLEADRLAQGAQMSEEGKKTIRFQGGKTVRL